MGAPHGHRLHFHGHSPIHRAPAHLKVAALVGFMLVVVATPLSWLPAFATYAAVLAVLVALSGVPASYLARRMVIETPVLVFAVVLPWMASGPRVELGVLTVSEPGLAAAAALVVKATFGVLASLLLAAVHVQVHAEQRLVAIGVGERDALEVQHGRGHRRAPGS